MRSMILSESVTLGEEASARSTRDGAMGFAEAADDTLFLEKLRAGDANAFETLVATYSDDVYRVLCRITEDPDEAADLTQDTFLRAFRSVGTFRGDCRLKTWLVRIAINESRNRFRWWRRRRREVTLSLDAPMPGSERPISDRLADGSVSPENRALAREREYALEAALLELPEKYRHPVILCDVEGLTYDEAAKALGLRLGTLKSRISRGRDELRRRLSGF